MTHVRGHYRNGRYVRPHHRRNKSVNPSSGPVKLDVGGFLFSVLVIGVLLTAIVSAA